MNRATRQVAVFAAVCGVIIAVLYDAANLPYSPAVIASGLLVGVLWLLERRS